MSELETLTHLINNILGSDAALRKESEIKLNQSKEENTDQYFLLLLQILRCNPL